MGLAFMLITQLPYFYGYMVTPPGHRFLWTHSLNSGDLYTYLGQINRVRQGEVLIRNSFTIDKPNRGMLRPTYLVLGWMARVSGMPAIGAFHMGRIMLGALFFVALYQLASLVLANDRERWAALALAATSSGLGWLMGGVLARAQIPDTWQPELNVFMTLYESPHFTASLLLITVSLLLLVKAALRARQPGALHGALAFSAAAGAATALLILEHPFDAATMALVASLVLGWAWRVLRTPARAVALMGLVYATIAAPVTLAVVAGAQSDPVAQRWIEQNVLPSPPVLGYVVGFGLLWPLAALGWFSQAKEPGDSGPSPLWFLGPWALLGFALVYLPVPYQRRLAEGWHLPLLLLAARGLGALNQRLPSLAIPPMWLGAAILAVGTGSLVLRDLRFYDAGSASAYVPTQFFEGVEHVASRVSHEDAVLANPFFSYILSGLSGCHVLAGHRIQTVILPETARTIEEGLRSLGTPAQEPMQRLRDLFFRSGLKYVAFDARGTPGGPKLLMLGGKVLAPPPGVQPIWENEEVAVYEASQLF